MKKLFYLLSISLLVLASCSKDDDKSDPDPATSVLLKKISVTNNNDIWWREFTYNGKKIVSSVSSDTTQTIYTYTGDLITKIEDKDKDGKVEYTREYSYTDGKLTMLIKRDKQGDTYTYTTKTLYTYNTDGTISYEYFGINEQTGVKTGKSTLGKYTFSSGNLVKDAYSYANDGENITIYEYDTKNNPSKNITGFNLLLDEEVAVNNLAKRAYSYPYGNGISTETYTYTYTYDANGFPAGGEIFYDGKSEGTVQYFY